MDSEIILHLLCQPNAGGNENNLVQTVRRIEGAYSLVIMTEQELIGVRDPFGFRPLCLGRVGDGWVLASESCALDLISAKFVRDIEPGEIVIIDQNGVRSLQAFPEHKQRAFCIFEYVYFARPDSTIANRNVYKVRVEMGRELAREHPLQADLVLPVPDSGNCAALGYSLASGIPYEMAFVRNHYVGRSFLQPSQLIRDFDVRVKLNLIDRTGQGQAGHRGGRFDRARDNLQGARQQFEGGGREGSACAGQLSAAHEPVRLWHRFSRPQQIDGGQPFALTKSGVISTRIRWPICPRTAWCGRRACPGNPFAWRVTTASIPCPTTRRWTSTSWNGAGRASKA